MRIVTELPECSLRRWILDDTASLVRHANDRRVWRNLKETFPFPYTADHAEHWITTGSRAPGAIHLAIDVGGDAIGGIGVVAGTGIACRTGRFGYWLGAAHWGRGIATAAARALAAHAFAGTALGRLEAQVFAWNPASMRVLEKAGFQREGVHRSSVFKDGELIDGVIYARLRDAAGA